jgi:hypothetical protein
MDNYDTAAGPEKSPVACHGEGKPDDGSSSKRAFLHSLIVNDGKTAFTAHVTRCVRNSWLNNQYHADLHKQLTRTLNVK